MRYNFFVIHLLFSIPKQLHNCVMSRSLVTIMKSFTVVARHRSHPNRNMTIQRAGTFALQEDELTAAAPINPCTPTPLSSIRPLLAAGWEWLYGIALEMTKRATKDKTDLFFANKFCAPVKLKVGLSSEGLQC